jgi:hypothetical protein
VVRAARPQQRADDLGAEEGAAQHLGDGLVRRRQPWVRLGVVRAAERVPLEEELVLCRRQRPQDDRLSGAEIGDVLAGARDDDPAPPPPAP